MSRIPLHTVREQITRLFTVGPIAGLDEAQLLERFLRNRDEVAFEAIVARHGPMVWSVCRRLVADPHAAEDAFQATFLVLVRRAGSLRDPERLGPWLYGVAHRVAARARQREGRRRSREVPLDAAVHDRSLPGLDPLKALAGAELHEELTRLPRPDRDVVVLCDLEDHTHAQAARLLGWPLGTVKGRLHRAREKLRNRLQRRGVHLSLAALGVALVQDTQAKAPAPLAAATVRAAVIAHGGRLVAGLGAGTPAAVHLAQGVTTTMLVASLAKSLTAVTGLGCLAAGVWMYQERVPGGESGAAQADAPVASTPTPADPFAAAAPASPSQDAAQEYLAAPTPTPTPVNPLTLAVVAVLDKPTDFFFVNDTPLNAVLGSLGHQTDSVELPGGLKFFVDPRGLDHEALTLQLPAQLELEGIPLKTCLRLLLRTMNLNYVVQDGLITISSEQLLFQQFLSENPEPLLGEPPVPGYGAIPRDWKPPAQNRPWRDPSQEQGLSGGALPFE